MPPVNEPVAIIGSACHFAGGVNSPSKLWDLLHNPRDVRSEIPDSRFSAKGFYHSNHGHHGHSNVMHSYLIEDDIRAFDAEFFGIKPIETKAMDPQQRMLMETVYEAIEAAGMTFEELKNSDTGVFVGAMCADYEALQLRDLDAIPTYFATGTARSILSNRISYFFDWHGPCMTIDTACSSSLVAVHQAVKALRAGESRMAVACGSNLILGPESYVMESKLKMLSPDGMGRMWDAAANGYARGDGVATIVLKTLSSAIADGDHIDCIIRETGINQDGATPGITMPSAAAQQALIESTYAKAGLDLSLKRDRPQLFEAHGTGTPAGDPVEAEAVSKAFFGQEKRTHPASDNLYVGSIKTILGHTEGTAGIAALLKASLAIQHGRIPPNLLFENLSPAVAPFYGNLEIPKVAQAWPEVLGAPKRVSVNSFGFGGTNAHAILESYDAPASDSIIMASSCTSSPLFTPYVFSAKSERSLKANLLAFATHLKDHPSYDAHNLAYTLRQRRSVFSHRVAYAPESLDGLRTDILASLKDEEATVGVKAIQRGPTNRNIPKILGIFTGQGAQYPRMGASLIEQSPIASQIIEDLELHLSQLPDSDRPTWSLRSELLASASRVHEATISQPLCTAVQIILVDLLRLAHVKFDAVVGHSSGEIAAAYAAGYLTARDAIIIAYCRGLYCQQSKSPNGNIKGAMLAVGTSLEDATELCEDETFAGRIHVAACNSSSSVTISGDEDAIEELEAILNDEKKFNRRLRVDKAYHSLHMLPCFDPYVESLHRANVKSQSPSLTTGCMWYSSVSDGSLMDPTIGPSVVYWAENMTQPVMFSQALAAALSDHGVFDLVLEVGAHPSLKGPSSQSIHDTVGQNIPYQGCLDRNMDAVQAMSNCLGFSWSYLDNSLVDLNAYETAISRREESRFMLIKDLPSYQWDHEVNYWQESRRSQRMRLRKQPFHSLLGDESPDSAPYHMRWKNVLNPSEISWLEGHQVQGQIVFPAAGYICTALEAAKLLAAGKEVRLIELSDFLIHQAITFEGDDSAVEVLIELSHVTEDSYGAKRAKFTYSAALGTQTSDLTLAAGGEVRIILGPTLPEILPKRAPTTPNLIDVEQQRLYVFMEGLGYNFTGSFRSLKKLKRKLGNASCELSAQPMDIDTESPLLLHPAEVDAAFQSIMLAYSYPGDDQLRTLHLPASIAKIRVNPALCASQKLQSENLSVDSTCNRVDRATPGSGFSGHVNLYVPGCTNAVLQVDGLKFIPFAGAVNEDRNVFYKMDWVFDAPDGVSAADGIPVTQGDTDLLWVLSRIASFYLRKFDDEVPADSPARTERPLCHYLNYARHMTGLLRSGQHKYAKREWVADTLDNIMENIKHHGFSDNADVKIMFLIGETMPRVFKQETTMIEHMRTSGLLDEYYTHGFGTMQSSLWLSQAVKQITDRHPHLSILEIGAGTGGATKNILKAIGQSFDSYTFTDISSSFFENAAETFTAWRDRMVFKVYDAERDAVEQGFDGEKYDVVVASLVIHATAKLSNTLSNLRKLLKPGGYLVVGEGTSDGPLQSGDGFIFGALPGWWLGVDEGRTLSPFVNVTEWDDLLKCTGFSGIDTLAPPKFLETFGIVLFVSQAVDDRISFLREPLVTTISPVTSTKIAKLVIIGGVTQPVVKLIHELGSISHDIADQVFFYKTLEDTDFAIVDEESTVISVAELDTPLFKEMAPERWNGFKKLFETSKTLLWITTGRLADEPWSNMPVGFGRSATNEVSELNIQFLDFPAIDSIDTRKIVESILRLHAKDLMSDDILWTAEPEVVIDAEGRHFVPRLNPITAANDRYNSIQRPIVHEVNVGTSVLELHQTPNRSNITELSKYDPTKDMRLEMMNLQTTCTVLSALKTNCGHQFLASGVDPNGCRYLAFVPRPLSAFDITKECAVTYDIGNLGLSEAEFLTAVAAHLISFSIINVLLPGQTILLHNVPPSIAQAFEIQASLKDVAVFCTTDWDSDYSAPNSWIRIPAYVSRSELSQILPSNLACFVGLSPKDRSENEDVILSTLSHHCRRETRSSIYSIDGIDAGFASTIILTNTLRKAVQFAQNANRPDLYDSSETVSLASIITEERPRNPMTIIDWVSPTSLPVQVTRLDLKPLFKGDKTYWLCGMSGALGISLCDWMIDRGVKHLVVTSRNPKIEESWVDNHKKNGVVVKIMLCDVTDEKALREVHEKIVQTMPPIAGALNGAMVLRDSSISNMQYDQVMDVIRPKVLGSLHLDRIFYNTNLDFFILVSSINCVIGNVGQANYAAANMYMCSLAANRRKRGLNAIAVNGGAIIGAGYITRETDRALDITVEKMALMHLSEEDFHQMIAEAIEAGYVDSTNGSEITTGLLDISPDSLNIPKWYSNPKFSRFIVHHTASDEDRKGQISIASIQDQLQTCKTQQELGLIVEQSFGDQVRKILQAPASMSNEEILSKRGLELGLDSLISVDIRSWFLKNFRVSIPVLKIMGNDTMASLVQSAVEAIPAEMVPQIPASATEEVSDNASSSSIAKSDMSASDHTSSSHTIPDPIDWEAESTPPADLASISLVSSSPPFTPPKVIVLTGATGLLGHHLLDHLIKNTSIEMIHCLAVRRLATRLQNKELPTDSRIEYHEGNLSDPLLGLSEQEAKSIFTQADVVIHNGADTSHVKFYTDLSASNVGSTIALTRLCLPRRIPMHYISSAGVSIYYNRDAFPEVSVVGPESMYPAADGSFGYGCSKWTNERFLERVHELYNFPVCIYRPSSILRDGVDATTSQAQLDWVNALLYYIRRIGAAPVVEHNRGALDLVRVESCCADVLSNIARGGPMNELKYVNQVGDIVIPMNLMQDMDADKGKHYDLLPLGEWISKAVKAGLHPAVAMLIQEMDEPGRPDYPKLIRGKGIVE